MTATSRDKLRNIAIIAHVDHGKTTLVDAMLKQTGVFHAHEVIKDRVMDSGDLERERGITILAKHASVRWGDYKINIIDTPGHADFGGEVERILRMADGALLLVDAAEGALPQTRFVLGKSIELGMPVIVVINKIDRKDARPDEALTETFDLFCDLGASDEQTDFPTIYAIGKEGIAKRQLADTATDLSALFETIVERIPAPSEPVDAPLQILVHNTIHDEYIGKVAIGRVRAGRVERNQQVMLIGAEKSMLAKVSNLFTFEKTDRVVSDGAYAGDIIALSGIDQVEIGDTLADPANPVALARIAVEEPTIRVRFLINTSPFAGQSGKFVTSRHLRERLYKEAQRNIALRVQDTDDTESFDVYGRGELMLSILAETMRREGYELALGMPEVVTKEIDGVLSEPLENVVVDVQDEHVGTVTQSILGERRGRMSKLAALGPGRTRMEFTVPSRGLIGFRSQFLTDTRGTGLLNTLHAGWEPYAGAMMRRKNGAIVSDRKGVTTPYALFGLQTHGELFIGSATDVYEGMIVGEHARNNDLDVNAVREKKLTNIRAAGKDENVVLTPPRVLSIDTGLDWLDSDELLEITPDAIRLRKRILDCNRRPKRVGKDAGS
ncbi:MAG: translational GTPase TypA [Sandaracinaceae bacterium]|jgi:GTP-binding protein|nr:translational GTPase TypA [Sandaracinaceae bacterium]MBK7152063.1 translational GTPase TypA [Sandaracinaceae bacterium]MBK8411000.1 translational GTPase TypA [Sandaracinaceae bacterium]MBP7681019.1 translational GTPase TypA [Deltaproteobacteria bacterium]